MKSECLSERLWCQRFLCEGLPTEILESKLSPASKCVFHWIIANQKCFESLLLSIRTFPECMRVCCVMGRPSLGDVISVYISIATHQFSFSLCKHVSLLSDFAMRRKWSHSSSLTCLKCLVRPQSCEKAMGWCTASQCKMLLFCAKTIVKVTQFWTSPSEEARRSRKDEKEARGRNWS